jgi:hypothetical protein
MIHVILAIWHWFQQVSGTNINLATGSKWYNFLSGSGSDFGEITLIGMAIAGFRHLNCHVKGCPRLGKHGVDGTPYKVCKKHHPDMPEEDITYAHISAAHARAVDRQNQHDTIKTVKGK